MGDCFYGNRSRLTTLDAILRLLMLNCSDFLADLGSYLEGEVSADVRLKLERHLAHCATCQVIADSTAKTLRVITESGEFDLSEELPESTVNRIMNRVRRLQRDNVEPEDDGE